MKGTKRTSVIAIALALVLALSVLVGAGIAPTVNENGTQPVNNEGTADGVITFNVVCDCHGNPVDATITGTAHYVLDPDSVVQPAEPTTTPSAEPTPTPTTAVEPSEDQVSTQADDQLNDPADDSSDADDPSDENQDQDQEQPKPDPTKDEKFEGKAADIKIAKTLTEENGAKYDLDSLSYEATATEYVAAQDTVNAADIVNNTVTISMTNPAPEFDTVKWTGNGIDSKIEVAVKSGHENENMYLLLFKDPYVVDVVRGVNKDGKTFPTVINVDSSNEETSIKEAFKDFGQFDRGENLSTAYIKKIENNTQSYTNVVFGADDRVIAVVDAHGNVTTKVINKYFNVSVDNVDGWGNGKKATIEVYGKKICKDCKLETTIFSDYVKNHYVVVVALDDQGNYAFENGKPVAIKKLRDANYNFEGTITKDGTYSIELWEYTGDHLVNVDRDIAEHHNVIKKGYEFSTSYIDTTAPTIDKVTHNNENNDDAKFVNKISVTAHDDDSGLAGVYMGAVKFDGIVDVKDKTESVDDGNGGTTTKTTYTVTVIGTCNGVAVYAPDSTTSDTKPDDKEIESLKNDAISAAKEKFKNGSPEIVKAIETAAAKENENNPQVISTTNVNEINKSDEGKLIKAEYIFADTELEKLGNLSTDFIIWAKDTAGNYSVVRTYGETVNNVITIDIVPPKVESVAVAAHYKNKDVALTANDFSDSKNISVTAKIKDDNVGTVTAYLLPKDGALDIKDKDAIKEELSFDKEKGIATGTITAKKDGEGYTVVVLVVDKAGNTSYAIEDNAVKYDENAQSAPFTIDTTFPTATCGFENFKPAEGAKGTADSNFYNNERVFTVNFTEKHYDSGEFVYQYKVEGKLDSEGNPIWKEVIVPFTEVSENGSVVNLVKGEDDSYTFKDKALFASDGDYAPLYVKIKDKAGNVQAYVLNDELKKNFEDGVQVDSKTIIPSFTIDKTDPEVKVDYSNQTPTNDKYFNENRTAKITVTEHNFNGEKVNILTKDFKEGDKPASGAYIIVTETEKDGKVQDSNFTVVGNKWVTDKNDGDVHTLEIEYSGSVNYKFNVVVVDRSGRISADVKYDGNMNFAPKANDDFDVDKEPPTITITGVTNGSAYNGEVGGTVEYKDANFQSATIRLMRADKNGVYDVTAQHTTALPTGAPGGTVNLVNFDRLLTNDGIYTLTATVVDMAGNTAESTVTFSVNRFGSTYKFDDYLASICDKHIKSVTDDLKITEINPDSITSGTVTITRNGKVIDSGDIAAVLQRSGSASGGWYEYLYTISKDLFKEDGMYKIVVSSKDAAGNEPNSENDEEFEIVFWVDDTPAEIAGIQGLEDAIINAENHTVKFTVRDNIGLKSVTVYCDSKEIAKFGEKDFTAGDLVDAQFTISEASSAQHIRIVAEDLSGNILDTDGTIEGSANTTVSFERDVTVSTNFFVRWFANKPLFFGSVAVIVAAGVGIYFIVAKKHKKEEATAE